MHFGICCSFIFLHFSKSFQFSYNLQYFALIEFVIEMHWSLCVKLMPTEILNFLFFLFSPLFCTRITNKDLDGIQCVWFNKCTFLLKFFLESSNYDPKEIVATGGIGGGGGAGVGVYGRQGFYFGYQKRALKYASNIYDTANQLNRIIFFVTLSKPNRIRFISKL